jgi:Ni,Fe-hydrogenase III small subunit
VFIGDCTADLAAEHAGRFVPGCPPDPEDILEALAKAGALE